MKKILLTLLAAIAALSVEAQIIEVRRGTSTEAEAVYDQNYKVKFRAKKTTSELTGYAVNEGGKSGTCKRSKVGNESEDQDQGWVQLWPNGPKFATNVITNVAYGDVASAVSNKWGPNWRNPTLAEMLTMLSTCTISYSEASNEKYFTINGPSSSAFIDAIPESDTAYIYLWTGFSATDNSQETKRIALLIEHTQSGIDIKIKPYDSGSAHILPILNE